MGEEQIMVEEYVPEWLVAKGISEVLVRSMFTH